MIAKRQPTKPQVGSLLTIRGHDGADITGEVTGHFGLTTDDPTQNAEIADHSYEGFAVEIKTDAGERMLAHFDEDLELWKVLAPIIGSVGGDGEINHD